MAKTMTFTELVVLDGGKLNNGTGGVVVTGGGMPNLDEAIPGSSTDLEIAYALDVSAVVGFFMICDQAMTIETNDGSSPDDTMTLTAGVPYVWHTGKPESFAFTTDITALFATSGDSNDATLKIKALVDATP